MSQMKIKAIWSFILIMLVLAPWLPAVAAEYPTRPINLIICNPPGGSTDLSIRPLANAAKKYLGQPIICENIAGGGATVGPTITASKPPDGYTIGLMLRSSIVAWHMRKLNFHPINDVTRIMTYTGFVQGLAVRTESPWKTIQEFIEYSRQNPGKVTYGSPGVGTVSHLPMEELALAAGGIQWVHIPYKGDAGTVPALLGGHVDAISATSAAWGPLAEGGKFRPLVIYVEKRGPRFPQVPTCKEIGYNVVENCPLEIFGPKGIPKSIVEKLHDAFKKSLDDPDFQAVLKKFDMPLLYRNPEESEKAAQQDFERYKRLVQKLGLDKTQ